ncbi:MAG: large repetitive protein [Solirubrobacteraceae bacterium]|jgi:hypothetical protein|nr:large repetitive protein [Solirubrobacteraceae bacterium]
MTGARAYALARTTFASTLLARPFDARAPQPGVRRVRALDINSEVVTNARTGGRSVMVSSVPLEIRGPNGAQASVDLTLGGTTGGYTPRSAIVPITIGKRLSDGVTFPGSHFAFRLEASGSDSAIASPSGVFFANAGGATSASDFGVNPVPAGAETYLQIRAATSPEQYVLHFTLPAGAALVTAHSPHPIVGDPPTAIAIVSAGTTLGYIYQPDAFDADGTQVPATAKIVGSNVVLSISHRGMNLHYPVLVDPVIAAQDYFTGSGQSATDWAGWKWEQSDTWSVANPAGCGTTCIYTFGEALDDPTYWLGLYTSMPINNYFKSGDYAFFYYASPPGTYVGGAVVASGHNVITAPFTPIGESNDVVGLGDANGWEANVSSYNGSAWQPGNPAAYPSPIGYNTLLGACFPNCDGGTATSTAYVGIQAYSPSGLVSTGGHRDTVTASSSTVYLGDLNPPAIAGSTVSIPNWTNDGGYTYTAAPLISDIGLGVSSVSLVGAGGTQTVASPANCGDYYRNPCPGSRAQFSAPFHYTLPEGASTLYLTATDPTGKTTTTPPTTVRIDRTSPTGAVAAPRTVSSTTTITGTASDPAGPGANATSGVASVTVQVQPTGGSWASICNGVSAAAGAFSCSWATLNGSYADGAYAVRAQITDNAGNPYTTPVAPTIVDNSPPSIVLDGGLTNGNVGATSSDLDVTAADGQAGIPASGVASIEVRIDGSDPGGQYLYTAAGCPQGNCQAENDFTLATASLAPGSHVATVIARDFAGNSATVTQPFQVNTVTPSITLTGPASPTGTPVGYGPDTVTIAASEPNTGSGIAQATLSIDGAWNQTVTSDCEGTVDDNTCALTGTFEPHGAGLEDGTHTARVVVVDNDGNVTQQSWPLVVDDTPPLATVTGSLDSTAVQAPLAAAYSLHVAATDGGTSGQGSGVTALAVYVDSGQVAATQQSCPSGGCPLALDFAYTTSSFSTGPHVIEVQATDAAGNVGVTRWTFNPQASGPIATVACASAASPQPAPPGATALSVSSVLALLTQVVPATIADTVAGLVGGTTMAPTLHTDPAGYDGQGSVVPTWVSGQPGGAVAVGDPSDPVCISPTSIDVDARGLASAGDAAAVAANVAGDTDEVTRSAAYGLESSLELRTKVAPQQFSWKVGLAPGDYLQDMGGKTIAVVRPYPFAASPDTVGAPDDASPQSPPDSQTAAAAGDTTFPSPPLLTFLTGDSLPTPDTPAPGSGTFSIANIPDAAAQAAASAWTLSAVGERVAGEVRAVISIPVATDANGAAVPVDLSASSSTLTLSVPHDASTAYPVTVDRELDATPATAEIASAGRVTSQTFPGGTEYKDGVCTVLVPRVYEAAAVEVGANRSVVTCGGDTLDVVSNVSECIRINQSGTQAYADFHDLACTSFPAVTVPVGAFPTPVTLCQPGTRSYAARITFVLARYVNSVVPYKQTYRLQGSPARSVACNASDLWKYMANHESQPAYGALRANLLAPGGLFEDPLPTDPKTSATFVGFTPHHLVPANDGRVAAATDARARAWMCSIGYPGPIPGGLTVPGGVPDPNAAVNGVFTRGVSLARAGDSASRTSDTPEYGRLVAYDAARGTDYHDRVYDKVIHTTKYYLSVVAALSTSGCNFPATAGGSAAQTTAQANLRAMIAAPLLAGSTTVYK